MTNERRRESNTQIIRTFPPACPLLRPQKCRLLVEDRRVDPLFFCPFYTLFLSFFRLVLFACLTMPALTKSTSEKMFALVVIGESHLSCSTIYIWIDLKRTLRISYTFYDDAIYILRY